MAHALRAVKSRGRGVSVRYAVVKASRMTKIAPRLVLFAGDVRKTLRLALNLLGKIESGQVAIS
jgi:hypothetical protein